MFCSHIIPAIYDPDATKKIISLIFQVELCLGNFKLLWCVLGKKYRGPDNSDLLGPAVVSIKCSLLDYK